MATVSLDRRVPRWALPHLQPVRYKGASGGRASGKSHFFAEQLVERCVRDPTLRAVCIREVQSSLKFSAKRLIEDKIRALGVEQCFEVLSAEIRHRWGDGIIIFEGMQDHTAESLKSLEGFTVAWVEEAQRLSSHSLQLLLPTIRQEGSEVWFSWNPDQEDDPVDAFFRESRPEDSVYTHNTYLDNPFCPQAAIREAERLKQANPDMYQHVWLGDYNRGSEGQVYFSFSRTEFPHGNVDPRVQDIGGEILIGQDFNVNPMASVIAVRAGDECHVLDSLEISGSNTRQVAEEYRRRYPDRHIVICPDPSGKARHTNAPVGQTDFTILEEYGFEIRAPNAAPPIVDRVNNTQEMLCSGQGRRRIRIHPRAKELIKALLGLQYKEGTNIRDKESNYDHVCDAFDYLQWAEFNVLEKAPSVEFGGYDISI